MAKIPTASSPKVRCPGINPEDGWVGSTAIVNVAERRQTFANAKSLILILWPYRQQPRHQNGLSLEEACWPLVPKFAGSQPAEAVGFLGRKNPQHVFLRRRSKAVGKRSLNVTWNSAFRHNFRTFLAHSSTFRRWVLSRGDAWWRMLERLTQIAQ